MDTDRLATDRPAFERPAPGLVEAIVEAARSAGNFHRRVAEMLTTAASRTQLSYLAPAEAWTLLGLVTVPHGTATTTSLSRAGGVSARRAVHQLRARGYVETSPSPADGRVAVLSLTEAGWNSATELLLALRLLMDAGFGDMPRQLGEVASELSATARRFGKPPIAGTAGV